MLASVGSVDLPSGYRTAEQLAVTERATRCRACRHTCVPQARAPSGVVVAARRQVSGAVARRSVPCFGRRLQACGDDRMGWLSGCRHCSRSWRGYPDDRAEIGRAAWAWSLTTSPWPGVVEPAQRLVVVVATGSAVGGASRVGGGWSGCR